MITGAHAVIFSSEAEELRAFFGTVLGLDSVDAGGGWLIFGLPPSEVAVHPSDGSTAHELYLLCDDVRRTRDELEERGVHFTSPISDEGWGLLTSMRLPGGGELGLYEAKHALAPHPPSGGQGEE